MSIISSGFVDTEPQVSTRSVRFGSGQPTYSMRTFAKHVGGTTTAGHVIEITIDGQLIPQPEPVLSRSWRLQKCQESTQTPSKYY